MQAVVAKIELATIPTRGMLQSEVYLSSFDKMRTCLDPQYQAAALLFFEMREGRAVPPRIITRLVES